MITLAVIFVLIVFSAIIWANDLQQYVIGALPGVGILLIIWGIVSIRRARARRRMRLGLSTLSFDEMNKARAKLVKSRSSQAREKSGLLRNSNPRSSFVS